MACPKKQDTPLSSIHGLPSGGYRSHGSAGRLDRTPHFRGRRSIKGDEKEIVMRKASDGMLRIGGAISALALLGAASCGQRGGPGDEATATSQAAVVPAANGPGQAPEIPPASIPR